MLKTAVFSGITRSDTEKLKACFAFAESYYMQGEKIYTYREDRPFKVGAVTEGEIIIVHRDEKKTYMTELYKKGAPFGELFALPPAGHSIEVFAHTDCTVLTFDYQRLVRPCEKACYCHDMLISNLFKIGAERTAEKNLHLSLLKEKNCREKLLAFLKAESEVKGAEFDLSLSQAALADYLCVDRSAMARALSELRKEGIIHSKGRHFKLSDE